MRVVYLMVAVCGLLFAPAARAELVERDWLAPGDGLLTLDTSTGLEWLDLSQSLLDDFPGVLAEDRYQAVLAETLPGGRFEGFRAAEADEAEQLALSAGVDPSTIDFDTNEAALLGLFDLISPTVVVPGSITISVGLLDEIEFNVPNNSFVRFGFVVALSNRDNFSDFAINDEYFFFSERTEVPSGVALVRQAVPEPAACCVMTGALLTTLLQRPSQIAS